MSSNNHKKILVTGASGFVGKHLVKRLQNDGYEVCVFIKINDNRSFFNKLGVGQIYEGDLSYNYQELKQAFMENQFSAVIHLAALIKAKWPDFKRVNVEATQYLIELAEAQIILPHFIFISTDFVLFDSVNDYKKSKLLGEELLRQSKLPYTILRPSPIYGPGDNKNLASLLKIIKKMPVLPAPSFTIYPLYVEDLTDAIIKVLGNKNVIKKEYNLPGGSVMSFLQMMRIMRNNLNKRCLLIPVSNKLFAFFVKVQEKLFKNPILNYYQVEKWAMNKPLSAEDARRDFSFRQTLFEVGIKKTIQQEKI